MYINEFTRTNMYIHLYLQCICSICVKNCIWLYIYTYLTYQQAWRVINLLLVHMHPLQFTCPGDAKAANNSWWQSQMCHKCVGAKNRTGFSMMPTIFQQENTTQWGHYSSSGLSSWWFQPLWKIWKSVGIIIPNIWKNVPKHQPVIMIMIIMV